MKKRRIEIFGAIALAEVLYLVLALRDWTNGWAEVSLFLGIFAAQFAILYFAPRPSLRTIVWSAILFRLTLLPAGYHDGQWQRFLLYDSDVWRYLWDGQTIRAGMNPYAHAPSASTGDSPLLDNINYRDLPTIYPPAAQLVFAFTPPTVLAAKLVFTGFDLLTLYFLIATLRRLGREPEECIWWAWNPLVIKAFAGSAHMDSLTCAAIAATLYYLPGNRALIPYVAAILSKWSPLVALPILARAGLRVWLLAPIAAVFAIPHLFDGVRAFAAFWEFNAGPFALLQFVTGSSSIAKALCAAVVAAVALWQARQKSEGDLECIARQLGYTFGALIVFSPAVMPWYVTWLLPLAIVGRDRAWIAFSGLVFMAFFVMADGRERWYILALEYTLLAWILWRQGNDTGNSGSFFGAR